MNDPASNQFELRTTLAGYGVIPEMTVLQSYNAGVGSTLEVLTRRGLLGPLLGPVEAPEDESSWGRGGDSIPFVPGLGGAAEGIEAAGGDPSEYGIEPEDSTFFGQWIDPLVPGDQDGWVDLVPFAEAGPGGVVFDMTPDALFETVGEGLENVLDLGRDLVPLVLITLLED